MRSEPAESCAPAKAGVRRASALNCFAGLGPCLRRGTGDCRNRLNQRFPSYSRPTRATAAGPGFCWRRSRRTSPCSGSRTAWRSSKAGESTAGAPDAKPHPRRGARCTRRAVGDGGGGKMRLALGRDRGIVGRPARARLHRHAAARGGGGALGRAMLAGAPRRHREPQRRADALADRKRPVAHQSARSPRAGIAGVGCGPVPRARIAAGPVEPRA